SVRIARAERLLPRSAVGSPSRPAMKRYPRSIAGRRLFREARVWWKNQCTVAERSEGLQMKGVDTGLDAIIFFLTLAVVGAAITLILLAIR
ncbi:MAG: hypothetical protein AB7P16_23415, partial [Bradyrhizobium sp.]|uniref:hypothetical protein n=1 Tax=Bradyrhizobium sp. TaxID=376 RepID=UPI003D13C4BE